MFDTNEQIRANDMKKRPYCAYRAVTGGDGDTGDDASHDRPDGLSSSSSGELMRVSGICGNRY